MGRFLFTIAGITLLLLFPIFLETDLHYDMNRKKMAFVVYLYGVLKIVGGYMTAYKSGFALHVTRKKAILMPYSRLDSERKRFSFVRTFRVRSFVLTTETGAEYLAPVATIHALLRTYFFIIGGKKEKIENNLWLTDGDVLKISLNFVLFFNLMILLANLFKFIKEKIDIIWKKKSKNSTN